MSSINGNINGSIADLWWSKGPCLGNLPSKDLKVTFNWWEMEAHELKTYKKTRISMICWMRRQIYLKKKLLDEDMFCLTCCYFKADNLSTPLTHGKYKIINVNVIINCFGNNKFPWNCLEYYPEKCYTVVHFSLIEILCAKLYNKSQPDIHRVKTLTYIPTIITTFLYKPRETWYFPFIAPKIPSTLCPYLAHRNHLICSPFV